MRQHSIRPGSSSDKYEDASRGSELKGPKRSIIDKIRGRNKDSKGDSNSVKTGPPSNVSLPLQANVSQSSEPESPSATSNPTSSASGVVPGAEISRTSTRQSVSQGTPKKEHHRLAFKSRKTYVPDQPTPTSDPDLSKDGKQRPALWHLDTDLTRMDDIVSNQQQVATSAAGGPPTAGQTIGTLREQPDPFAMPGAWDAPDSWAIKKSVGGNVGKLQELDETEEMLAEEDSGMLYGIRIFRTDNTFMTLNLKLSTTAGEIVQTFARKSMLQEDLDNYHIIMRKDNTSRQLHPGERPILLQKKLLEQVGYRDHDRIESLGREDHSYLCRFSFSHAKMTGYSSLEKDPGFNKSQKLTNVDLSGHNLITMPIQLYHKCGEIVALNLSRNISMDIPKDFIQQCTSLKELKFCSNEASRLPPSFSLASKLIIMDISNNRLDQLDHAQLERLESLSALSAANNRLSDLPSSFINLKSLRRLIMSSNSLDKLPEAVLGMEALTDLDISFNQISNFSDIGRLQQLARLYATNNKLSGSLDATMSSLTNLEELDVRFNTIDNIDVCSKMPRLEVLAAGHNMITSFDGSLPKMRSLTLDHNPITKFGLQAASPSIHTLDLASAKLAHLPDELFQMISSLVSLNINKNHFVAISLQIGRLQKLERLSAAKNALSNLPPEIGRLSSLRYLDVRENNMTALPSEIWFCRGLETLNASCNVMESFPKPPNSVPSTATEPVSVPTSAPSASAQPPSVSTTPGADGDDEERDTLSDVVPHRRASQVSGYMGSDSSNASSTRKSSLASLMGATASRKPSVLSRTSTETTLAPMARKESVVLNRVTNMFAGSLKYLYLADNRLGDDVFDQIGILQELKVLNLSHNDLDDIMPHSMRKFKNLEELYLSTNTLSSIPSEDLEELDNLRVLFINGNRFQVLPAELAKLTKLSVLDSSSNILKYNVCNWPYDWNWNSNPQLKYLSLSGNKRLEIRPPSGYNASKENQRLTDFTALSKLRVLGLMDVTILINSIPDNTEDRRVRTSGSSIGSMPYGIADALGQCEHVSSMDMIIPKLEGHEDETLWGLFDGMPSTTGGSKIVKYLQDNFEGVFKEELRRATANKEPPTDAIRRAYLALNKNLSTMALQAKEDKARKSDVKGPTGHQPMTSDDLTLGCVATIMYLHGMELHVSNIGDTQAILIQSEGGHRFLTEKHDPASMNERRRVRDSGGYVSRHGKLNDQLHVSRAFGFTNLLPSIIAEPHISSTTIEETDEIILLASRELWDYLTPDFVVDLARSERADLMRASQKLRDLTIAFGARGNITVMMVGVSDLRKRERARYRSHSLSLGPSGLSDEYLVSNKSQARRPKRGRGETAIDSKLARLDQEVEAPVGDVTLVFTDIKSSTQLWELFPTAMRSAIKQHNEVLRRQLRMIGGYEVKTEGDAFMVAFPTVTSALLWTFTVQMQLLDVQWPQEILHSMIGQEDRDTDGNLLFRGLSVRMGIHWGVPVCETDPVTRRMDYFGPMVNRAARISGIADGGQITVSSDYIGEIQRLLETHIENDRSNSTGSEEHMEDDAINANIRRELRSLSSHGFEVKDLGEKRLKGLENMEYVYLMYPHSLAGRLPLQEQRAAAEKAAESAAYKVKDLNLSVDLENVWDLWTVSLRLEMLCSSLENPGSHELKPPETALLEMTKERGDVITERFLLNFVEHQVSRIEVSLLSMIDMLRLLLW